LKEAMTRSELPGYLYWLDSTTVLARSSKS
jgi:hypothetical protein